MALEDYGSRLALDARALDDLKARAKTDPRAAVREAARQFEAYFMQSMLKSMRDTLSGETMVDNDQSRFYTSLFDQQLAQKLAGDSAFGLARLLERQLAANLPGERAERPAGPPESSAGAARGERTSLPAASGERPAAAAVFNVPAAPTVPAALQENRPNATSAPLTPARGSPRNFVAGLWPHAVEAAGLTGLPPHLLVAHAALESGWGRAEPRRADGSPTYNLFGIKAGRGWRGDSVELSTTEYVGGAPTLQLERFRAYGSYREAFADYAKLLAGSPRFADVLSSTSGTDFAESLQKSGYATDPMYAAKLSRIIQGKTLREALQG